MFSRLYRNIYLPIVLIAFALIVFTDVFSLFMLTDMLKDAYNEIGQKRVARSLDSCELYISSAAASTYNLSVDNDLIEELSSPTGKPLVEKLDNVCNYSLKINAVCAYSANGAVYTSSGVSQVPTLDELKTVKTIAEFLEGNESATLSFRTEAIADIYGNVYYPDGMGVITCCRKVFRDDAVVGWIFTDVLPANLYGVVFSNGQFENAVAFISANGTYFSYAGNSENEALLSGAHSGYFKYEAAADDGTFALAVFESTKAYATQVSILSAAIALTSILLAAGVHFAADFTAKSLTARLEKLVCKMNSQDIP